MRYGYWIPGFPGFEAGYKPSLGFNPGGLGFFFAWFLEIGFYLEVFDKGFDLPFNYFIVFAIYF